MAATSDDLFNNYFANVLDGAPCYARTYSEAHLKAHPAQRVREIEIDLSKANSDGTPNSADRFGIGFSLMLTSGGRLVCSGGELQDGRYLFRVLSPKATAASSG